MFPRRSEPRLFVSDSVDKNSAKIFQPLDTDSSRARRSFVQSSFHRNEPSPLEIFQSVNEIRWNFVGSELTHTLHETFPF